MTDKTAHIGEIVEIMLNTWDLPADCNEGELFTYAETLYDRITAGDSEDKLYAYLSETQVDHLELAKSDAFKHCRSRGRALKGPTSTPTPTCRQTEAPGSAMASVGGPAPSRTLVLAGLSEALASAGSLISLFWQAQRSRRH